MKVINSLGTIVIGCAIGVLICFIPFYWQNITQISIVSAMGLAGMVYIAGVLAFRESRSTNKGKKREVMPL